MTIGSAISILWANRLSARLEGEAVKLFGDPAQLEDYELISTIRSSKDDILEYLRNGGVLDFSNDGAPPNLIPPRCEAITPDMLTLVELTQAELDTITKLVPGGASAIQDIYPLTPLQEGILFHHLAAEEADPYAGWSLLSFADLERLEAFVAALDQVIARHDILRSAVVWEGISQPVQVVLRQASAAVELVVLDAADGSLSGQLKNLYHSGSSRLDLLRPPLMRLVATQDLERDCWLLYWQYHHLIGDNASWRLLSAEVGACLAGQAKTLPPPLPYRLFVARARTGVSEEQHKTFFNQLLAEVNAPTAPFGLLEMHGDTWKTAEARLELDAGLSRRLRERARLSGVSVATLCHVAWGLVVARTSGREEVVFGTVMFGRMGGTFAGPVLGPFVNTLPVRLKLDSVSVQGALRQAHAQLTALMRHEHASLALAQGCSGVAAPTPLFSAILNYRHGEVQSDERSGDPISDDIRYLTSEERTNFPISLTVEELGENFRLVAQTVPSVEPARLCAMMQTAMEQLVEVLETDPDQPICEIDILPPEERRRVLVDWNGPNARRQN